MKNKIFTKTNENKFARDVLPGQSGLFLVKGSIKLDDTHLSLPDETFLVILTADGGGIIHSFVICSLGGFFDDVKVWGVEDGEITKEKLSAEVQAILDAIKYSYTPVPLTDTASTNKTQLDLFLSKVPNAQVMHVTYNDVYAGTLHYINGSWFGVLVGESNTLAGQLSIKLQADGTIVEGTA